MRVGSSHYSTTGNVCGECASHDTRYKCSQLLKENQPLQHKYQTVTSAADYLRVHFEIQIAEDIGSNRPVVYCGASQQHHIAYIAKRKWPKQLTMTAEVSKLTIQPHSEDNKNREIVRSEKKYYTPRLAINVGDCDRTLANVNREPEQQKSRDM